LKLSIRVVAASLIVAAARQDPESREVLDAAAIRMPAWRGRLSHAQVDDLVTYMRALAAADIPEGVFHLVPHSVHGTPASTFPLSRLLRMLSIDALTPMTSIA
jgi:hypothetical protein